MSSRFRSSAGFPPAIALALWLAFGLASPCVLIGCGSSEDAALSDEEAKNTRAYRLSHDRIDSAIKAKEAKDAKKSAKRGTR